VLKKFIEPWLRFIETVVNHQLWSKSLSSSQQWTAFTEHA